MAYYKINSQITCILSGLKSPCDGGSFSQLFDNKSARFESPLSRVSDFFPLTSTKPLMMYHFKSLTI